MVSNVAMNGIDETATALNLAKNLLTQCAGTGDILLPKETLRLVLMAFITSWHGEQDRKRSEFKKAL